MPFSIAGYLVGRFAGERKGITDDAVLNRLSLMGAMMGSTPVGLVMTTLLAQREAEDTTAPPTTTAPTPAVQVEVPDVRELPFSEAERKLESLGLVVARRDLYSITTTRDSIINQSPEPKAIVSQGATITLSVSLGSELPAQCTPSQTGTAGANAKKTAHAAGGRG
jgi:hypothetical protein